MDTHVVNTDNEDQWRRLLYEFARDLDLEWRCNIEAVMREDYDQTYPSEDIIDVFIRDDENLVMVLEDDDRVVGYVLSSPNGLIKWAGVSPAYEDRWEMLIYGVRAVYGVAWGRVQNEQMRKSVLDNVPGLRTREDDSEIVGIWED